MQPVLTLDFSKHITAKILLLLSLAITFLLSPSPARSATPLTQIAYWKFDEVRSDSFSDSVAVRDGYCADDCPLSVRGVDRAAQRFDGTAGIEIPTQGEFAWDNDAEFSIELWMKGEPSQTCVTTDEVMIGWGNPNVGGWTLGCSAENGRAQFWLGDSRGNSILLESNRAITNGRWHHIVGIHDGLNDVSTLIVDGTDAVSVSQRFSGTFGDGAAVLHVGKLGSEAHYVGSLDEVSLYEGILPETEILSHYYLARPYGATCATPTDIMPLGDSITRGYGTGLDDPTDFSQNFGYRLRLDNLLTDNNHYFDFVGNEVHGYLSGHTFDFDHEGHGGFPADQIAANVGSYLTANPPELILLHIGTNDIAQGQGTSAADVDTILDEIDTFDEQITVILALIVDQSPSNPQVATYNTNLQTVAQTRINNGDKIILVNQNTALTYPDDMFDTLHPNESGYNKMADVWFTALESILPDCPPPEISSTPPTSASVGQPYTYDVNTTGEPEPAFTLTTAPIGMTIDSATGLISWTPSENQGGTHPVEVEATNAYGTDTQLFTITVAHEVFLPTVLRNP